LSRDIQMNEHVIKSIQFAYDIYPNQIHILFVTTDYSRTHVWTYFSLTFLWLILFIA
jgi:hypothetical protein